jgi:hypothetical protein
MFRKISRNTLSDQRSASARRPAGDRAKHSGARAVRTVPDLHSRPADERHFRRQRRHNHHPRRHPGQPRHHDPRQGHRAEPDGQSHRRRPSNGRPTGRHNLQHPNRRRPADLRTGDREQRSRRQQATRHRLYAGRQVPAVQPGRQFLLWHLQAGRLRCIASVNATTGLLSDYAHVSCSDGRQRIPWSDHRHLLREQPWGHHGSFLISRAATPLRPFQMRY